MATISHGDRKLQDLMRRLSYSTQNGSTSWQQTDREFTFQATLGENTIVIGSVDNDGIAPFKLQILDNAGDEIDSLETKYLRVRDTQGKVSNRTAPHNGDLAELYEIARRNAYNIDSVVDNLLAQLPPIPDDEPPF